MKGAKPCLLFYLFFPAALLAAGCSSVSSPGSSSPSPWKSCDGDEVMMKAVKTEFLHFWKNYATRAFGHDALDPVTGLFSDVKGGPLALTLVDSLDALWLMGEKGAFKRAADFAAENVTFKRDAAVDMDTAAARLLGGLLSAYRLSGDTRLLGLARGLGNRLLPAFGSPTGLPYPSIDLKTGECSGKTIAPAAVAVLNLELGRLSLLCHDPRYARAARGALLSLWDRRSSIDLLGSAINVETGEWTDTRSGVGPGVGKFYAALLDASLLFRDKDLARMHERAFAAARRFLEDPRGGVPWYGMVSMEQGMPVKPWFGAGSAFWPGHLLLCGRRDEALLLHKAWFSLWEREGLEPELYDYAAGKMLNPGYMLRPGIVESALLLRRRTGDPLFREQGKRILKDIAARCRTKFGYVPLIDLKTGGKAAGLEGCFPEEIFKNLYLLFSPSNLIDFDDWILGPGGHPMRRE